MKLVFDLATLEEDFCGRVRAAVLSTKASVLCPSQDMHSRCLQQLQVGDTV